MSYVVSNVNGTMNVQNQKLIQQILDGETVTLRIVTNTSDD